MSQYKAFKLLGGTQQTTRRSRRSSDRWNRRDYDYTPRTELVVDKQVVEESCVEDDVGFSSRPKIELAKYEREVGKGRFSFTAVSQTLETLSELPQIPRRDYLSYIVLPAGCGKTYLAEKYGFLDIDCCCPPESRGYLMKSLTIVSDTSEETKRESKMWIRAVRMTLASMTFTKPTVLLVHDDMTGYMVGAIKLGEFNLPLSYKLARVKGQVRKKLVEINDTIHRKFVNADECSSHDEIEVGVINLVDRIGVSRAHDDIAIESVEDGEAGVRAGKVSKESLDKYVLANDCKSKGYGVTMNMWALAISAGMAHKGRPGIKCNMNWFKENVDYSHSFEVRKIMMNSEIDDDDKLRRIAWWESKGRYMNLANSALALIENINSSSMDRAAQCFSLLIYDSKYLFDQELGDRDRAAFCELISMYIGACKFKKMDKSTWEERDYTSRLTRVGLIRARTWLKDGHKTMLERNWGMSCDRISEMVKQLKDWALIDVISLADVLHKFGDQDLIGADAMRLAMKSAGILASEMMSKGNVHFRDVLTKDANKYQGLVDLVYTDGLSALFELQQEEVDEWNNELVGKMAISEVMDM